MLPWTLVNRNRQNKLTNVGVFVMEPLVSHIRSKSVFRNRPMHRLACSSISAGHWLGRPLFQSDTDAARQGISSYEGEKLTEKMKLHILKEIKLYEYSRTTG